MTLTLDVAPDIERALADKAARAGLPLGEYVRQVIERAAFDGDGAPANGKAAAPPARPAAQPIQFSDDRETRNAQLRALMQAPPEVFAATMQAAAQAAEEIYAKNPDLTEFTDALQNDPWADDDDD